VSHEEKGCQPLLPLPNPVPHPVSFHITVVFFKNQTAIILLFAAITTWGVVPVSVYYINTVKVTDEARVLS
jgi:hypothetical protein